MLRHYHYRRGVLLGSLVLAGLMVVEGRLYYLQIQRHWDLGHKARQYEDYRPQLPAWRGEIRARGGDVLVCSRPVRSVYANLEICGQRPAPCARILAAALGLEPARLCARLRTGSTGDESAPHRQALLLKRNVSEAEWCTLTNALHTATFGLHTRGLGPGEPALLRQLRHAAIWAEEDQERACTPLARTLLPLLGGTVVDESGRGLVGVGGLEGAGNAALSGVNGVCISKKDAAGREVPVFREQRVPPRPGSHLELTIDPGLQEICIRALAAACAEHTPSNAVVLIMEPESGDVLAWASWPFQTPGDPAGPVGEVRNPALQDALEPGSVFKALILVAALNEGVVTLDQWIDAQGGQLRFRGARITDRKHYGRVTVRQGIAQSINIVFVKLALALGPERLERYIRSFGFGRRSGIGLPGESCGHIPGSLKSSPFTQTRVPIGQGISVNLLQLAMLYCALGNEGRLMQPRLIRRAITPDGHAVAWGHPTCLGQPVTPQSARLALEGLTGVVSPQGTGRGAILAGYPIAGKTGTAQIANELGYVPGAYNASFVGLAPASRPRLCIVVSFRCPQNGHTGAAVAVPVFREIARQAVEYLQIAPDQSQPSRPVLRLALHAGNAPPRHLTANP